MTNANVTKLEKQQVLSKAVVRAAESLGLRSDTLAGVLGLDAVTTAKLCASDHLLTSEEEAWGRGVSLILLYDSLLSITGGSESDARKWLLSANSVFNNQAPIDLMITVAGLDRLVSYLETQAEGPV
jgi:uncharacterized protein (DUF2384 family)